MDCLFCRLIETKDCAVVFENKNTFAFLDHRPVFKGHVLFLPKAHFETLADLPKKLIPDFFETLQRISKAVETAMQAHGSFLGTNNKVSQSVPHLHFHIVPRKFKDGLRGFFWPRTKYESETEKEKIRKKIAGLLK